MYLYHEQDMYTINIFSFFPFCIISNVQGFGTTKQVADNVTTLNLVCKHGWQMKEGKKVRKCLKLRAIKKIINIKRKNVI